MICSFCHHDNPASNHFCGNCGLAMTGKSTVEEELDIPEFDPEDILPPMTREPAKAAAPVVEEKAPPPQQTTISGPSFLGLTDSTDSQDSYLLEDEEPRRGRVGWIVFSAVAVIVLSVIGWIEWNAYKTGTIQIPFLSKSVEHPKATEEDQGAAAATSTDAASSKSSETKPESADSNLTASKTELPNAPATPTPPATPANSSSESAATSEPATKKPEPAAATPAPIPQPTPTKAEPAPPPTPRETASKPVTARPKPVVKEEPAPKPQDPRKNAMLLLGENYLYGHGVPRNCPQALTYFQSAAKEDNAPAMSHLGAMYASGNCVTMNRRTAYQWFVRASNSDPHNQWIQRNMNMLWRDMSTEERASVSNQ